MKIIIGVLILGIVGAGVYVFMNQSSSSNEINANLNETSIETESHDQDRVENLAMEGTLEEIRSRGSVKCEYVTEYSDEGVLVESAGTIYHENGRVRVDSQVATNVDSGAGIPSMETSMIILDETAYTWSDMGAIQIDLAQTETLENDTSTPVTLLEQNFRYECENWQVDESVFTLPSGIEFIDMQAMMEINMQQLEEMSAGFEAGYIPEPQ